MTPTEHCRVALKIPNDPRALGAVRGALEHTARHLGLPSRQEEDLIALTDRLLRAAFDLLMPGQTISILIQEHPDRIEIELERPARAGEQWPANRTFPGVDAFEEQTAEGRNHLKLVKLLPRATEPSPARN